MRVWVFSLCFCGGGRENVWVGVVRWVLILPLSLVLLLFSSCSCPSSCVQMARFAEENKSSGHESDILAFFPGARVLAMGWDEHT